VKRRHPRVAGGVDPRTRIHQQPNRFETAKGGGVDQRRLALRIRDRRPMRPRERRKSG
jgi:hypothetical protein